MNVRGSDGIFSLRRCVQTGSGANLGSYSMDIGRFYPGVKEVGASG